VPGPSMVCRTSQDIRLASDFVPRTGCASNLPVSTAISPFDERNSPSSPQSMVISAVAARPKPAWWCGGSGKTEATFKGLPPTVSFRRPAECKISAPQFEIRFRSCSISCRFPSEYVPGKSHLDSWKFILTGFCLWNNHDEDPDIFYQFHLIPSES
jgi:hypothetical protein